MPKQNKLADLGEFGLIRNFQKQIKVSRSVVKGIGDDAAVLSLTAKQHLLLTTDMLMENVHFKRSHSPEAVGHKAMACNISDIAAMGGMPQYAVVSLGISGKTSVSYVNQLYRGMQRTARKFGVSIVGGDTIRSKKTIINVALTGVVDKQKLVMRSGAKVGDQIFVTGPLGCSYATNHHLKFMPRLFEAQFLVKQCRVNAMIDISDGLAADLGHILKASGVGAIIDKQLIPRRDHATINEALYDGEDFELLFTLSKSEARKLLSQKNKRYPFYMIGEITPNTKGFMIREKHGILKKVLVKGYRHF